jgi:hypothetical protein
LSELRRQHAEKAGARPEKRERDVAFCSQVAVRYQNMKGLAMSKKICRQM